MTIEPEFSISNCLGSEEKRIGEQGYPAMQWDPQAPRWVHLPGIQPPARSLRGLRDALPYTSRYPHGFPGTQPNPRSAEQCGHQKERFEVKTVFATSEEVEKTHKNPRRAADIPYGATCPQPGKLLF